MELSSYLAKHIGLRVIDVARKTQTVPVLKKLRSSEFANIVSLESIQLERLRQILIHCKYNVPYYRSIFCEVGFDPEKLSAVSDIQCLPILTKDDIRSNFEQLKAKNFKSFRPRVKETGGSTGQPLRLYHDELSHSYMWANIYRGFGFGGYNPGDKYLTIASGSLLPKKLKFGRNLYFLLQNSLIVPSYHIEKDYIQEVTRLIDDKKPRFVYGYSSSLLALANALVLDGQKLDCIEAIFTTADMLYPNQRRIIEEVLGAPVFDNYGCPEAGVMTFECEEHDGYHYNMESCYIEIEGQDDQGVGRVISSNLTNYAFPVIRYDTGDIAAINRLGLCACGRSHSKVVSLLGRQRDILTLSSGKMVHGAFFNHFAGFYDNTSIQRYQIIQTSIDRLEVHLQLGRGASLDELGYLKRELETALDDLVSVELIENEFRESSLSRKHRTVISDIDNIWTDP